MTRILGVVGLLATMYLLLLSLNPAALKASNQAAVINRQAFTAILTLGAGVLIITGGIDLSLGSVVGLGAITFGVLMRDAQVHPYLAILIVLAGGVAIGLIHALLVTRLQLQPFLVTLCGLFVYRGLARVISKGRIVDLSDCWKEAPEFQEPLDGLMQLLIGKGVTNPLLQFPRMLLVLLALAGLVAVLLHASRYGRYCYAIGHSEQAARYAGINTNFHRTWVYVLCSTLASLGGILILLDYQGATPETTGDSLELYVITGAVLGGCSLRGGEGTVLGMVLGAAVLPLLRNLIDFVGNLPAVLKVVPKIDSVIPIVIGLTLLLGTLIDEFFRRRSRLRK